MTYQQTIDYLFAATPQFEQQGGSAYKPGLERVLAMAEAIGSPHLGTGVRYIHVAGTNGKGSTSSTLAAILSAAGYRTGLFTSPHLVDFRERIRIDGVPIEECAVVDFVERTRPLIERFSPSFFELTTLMALHYFAAKKVDVAIIEVGMGGRLDSTNIITPELSIVTNISLDHTQFLGSTLEEIAGEKAGIFKPHVPALVGEANASLRVVFRAKAELLDAPLYFAEDSDVLQDAEPDRGGWLLHTRDYGTLWGELGGAAQRLNARTILAALAILTCRSFQIPRAAVEEGFAHVVERSHLLGRWQKVASQPATYCDTGHNEAGIRLVVEQLKQEQYQTLHIVFGMVADKDWHSVLRLLPASAHYYFVQPTSDRALSSEELAQEARYIGLEGAVFPSIEEGCKAAQKAALPQDLIYIGGSNYVVAEALKKCYPHTLESVFNTNY